MIDAAINTLLRNASELAEKVKPSVERVNVVAGLPKLVFSRLPGTDRRYTDDGANGPFQARYQVDIFAEKLLEAVEIARRITSPADDTVFGLDGYRGTVASTFIHRVYFTNEHWTVGDTEVDGKQQTIPRYIIELIVEYRELQPPQAP